MSTQFKPPLAIDSERESQQRGSQGDSRNGAEVRRNSTISEFIDQARSKVALALEPSA